MLQQFSWKDFLIFSALLSALWYVMLALTVYRKTLSGLVLKPGPAGPLVARGVVEESLKSAELAEDQVMGKSKLPEGLEIVSMGALNFSLSQDLSYPSDDAKANQLGLVADVLEELKEIFAILAKEDGTKQDFFSLAALISEKYGRIGSSPNIGRINEFIRDHAPFTVSVEELENLWD